MTTFTTNEILLCVYVTEMDKTFMANLLVLLIQHATILDHVTMDQRPRVAECQRQTLTNADQSRVETPPKKHCVGFPVSAPANMFVSGDTEVDSHSLCMNQLSVPSVHDMSTWPHKQAKHLIARTCYDYWTSLGTQCTRGCQMLDAALGQSDTLQYHIKCLQRVWTTFLLQQWRNVL